MARSEVIPSIKPTVCIIILNWNGWRDTVECLESVARLDYPGYRVLIVDNGSDDDSVIRIQEWAAGKIDKIETAFRQWVYPLSAKPLPLTVIDDLRQSLQEDSGTNSYLLLALKENLGFARGVNTAIDFARKHLDCAYFFLLNNDTVVLPKALTELMKSFKENTELAVAQSTVYYYDQPQHIHNAGGKIFPWGQTKYYKSIAEQEIKPITFINGCAFCLPKTTIEKYGKLTESFFFGEEDFEFSMRAKKQGFKMVAVGSSKVYHKIAASSKKRWDGSSKTVLVFALNRLVDMRGFYSRGLWNFWRVFSTAYFWGLLFFKYRVSLKLSLQTVKKIFKYSKKLDQVKKEDIEKILNEN